MSGLMIPISNTYVGSVVYTSISASGEPFIRVGIISGSHATNRENPDKMRNTFIPLVKKEFTPLFSSFPFYKKMQVIQKEKNSLENIVSAYDKYNSILEDIDAAKEVLPPAVGPNTVMRFIYKL